MSKAEVNPEDNIWVNLSEGALHILGERENEVHGGGSRLYYGYGITDGRVVWNQGALPFVHIEDLRKLKRFSIDYHRLNDHTEARRNLSGGLYVRRRDNHKDYSTFSREEFKTIEQYF